MRVAYLSGAPLPARTANSIHVVKMCNALASLGHDVVLYSPAADPKQVFPYYGIDRSFLLQEIPHHRFRYAGHLYGLAIARAAKRWGADVCVGRHPTACLAAALRGIPTVFETHAPIDQAGRLTGGLFQVLIRTSAFRGIVVITEALAARFRRDYPELTNRLIVAPDGADPVGATEAADIRRRNLLNVGYTGHLYPGKGIEVVNRIAPMSPFAHFHIVGGREEDVAHWQKELEGQRNVTFYGHVPHEKVPAYLAAFDVALLPNQASVRGNAGKEIGAWTSPLKLFEYMAGRCALVASDLPVLKEVLRDGENAILCDPVVPEAWRDALLTLHENPMLRKRLAARAHDEFLQRYTWRARADFIVKSAFCA